MDGSSKEERSLLFKVFEKIEAVLDMQYSSLNSKLQNDFQILDPCVNAVEFSHLDKSQIQEVEDRFLKNLETALERGNFKPLSQDMVRLHFDMQYMHDILIFTHIFLSSTLHCKKTT